MKRLAIIAVLFASACSGVNTTEDIVPYSEVFTSKKTGWKIRYLKGLEEALIAREANPISNLSDSPYPNLWLSVNDYPDPYYYSSLSLKGCNTINVIYYGRGKVEKIVPGFNTLRGCVELNSDKKMVPSSRQVMGTEFSRLASSINYINYDKVSGDLLLMDEDEIIVGRFSPMVPAE